MPNASLSILVALVRRRGKDPLKRNQGDTTILRGELADEVAKLRREIDGVILVAGSAQLVQSLIEHDLVDELRLMVFPVLLGEGKRLFGEVSEKKPLVLADSKTVGAGIALLTYERG